MGRSIFCGPIVRKQLVFLYFDTYIASGRTSVFDSRDHHNLHARRGDHTLKQGQDPHISKALPVV